MTLREYFSLPGAMTQTALAEKLGVSKQTVNHYVIGRRKPPGDVGLRIVELTGGAIQFADLYPMDSQSQTQERVNG